RYGAGRLPVAAAQRRATKATRIIAISTATANQVVCATLFILRRSSGLTCGLLSTPQPFLRTLRFPVVRGRWLFSLLPSPLSLVTLYRCPCVAAGNVPVSGTPIGPT